MGAGEVSFFDLFCGAGGASEGLVAAAGPGVALTAVNHWQPAIATHRANYPWARHFEEDVRRVDPRQAIGKGGIRLGVAGPDCTHHSNARGGKPRSSGQRALAWDVVRWARLTEAQALLIENVPEFVSWGPLTPEGARDRSRAGEYFEEFLAGLRRLGYAVDWRILCAADYGDATTRRRLFIQARQDGRISWPESTHSPNPAGDLFGGEKWRSAAQIIDWSIPGASIFTRAKPLAEKTMTRIVEGVRRFAGESFVVPQLSCGRVRALSEPLPTLTATGTGNALVTPFLLGVGGPSGRQKARPVSEPLGTVLGANHQYLVEPFLLSYYGTGRPIPLSDPLPTMTGRDRFALAEPIALHDGSRWMVADIRFRMLQPHELAAAHSFPAEYDWTPARTKSNRVRLIGNSWPVRTATALCREMLGACA